MATTSLRHLVLGTGVVPLKNYIRAVDRDPTVLGTTVQMKHGQFPPGMPEHLIAEVGGIGLLRARPVEITELIAWAQHADDGRANATFLLHDVALSTADQTTFLEAEPIPDHARRAVCFAPWADPAVVVRNGPRDVEKRTLWLAMIRTDQVTDEQVKAYLGTAEGTPGKDNTAAALRNRPDLWAWAVEHQPVASSYLGLGPDLAGRLAERIINGDLHHHVAAEAAAGLLLRPETPGHLRRQIIHTVREDSDVPLYTGDEPSIDVRTTTDQRTLGLITATAGSERRHCLLLDVIENEHASEDIRNQALLRLRNDKTVKSHTAQQWLHNGELPAPATEQPPERSRFKPAETFDNDDRHLDWTVHLIGDGPIEDVTKHARTFAGLLARYLGDDEDRWEIALSLCDGFNGTVGELLGTVDATV